MMYLRFYNSRCKDNVKKTPGRQQNENVDTVERKKYM